MTNMELATRLGFLNIGFVIWDGDTVSFSIGKPEEICSLYARVVIARMVPSRKLIDAVVSIDPGRHPWSAEYVAITYPRVSL